MPTTASSKRETGEGGQHIDDESAAGERAGNEGFKRLDVRSGLCAVGRGDGALHRRSQGAGIAVGADEEI